MLGRTAYKHSQPSGSQTPPHLPKMLGGLTSMEEPEGMLVYPKRGRASVGTCQAQTPWSPWVFPWAL